MTQSSTVQSLRKGLEYKFLYQDDPTSMQLLLSMLENEYRVYKVRPEYQCMRRLCRSLGRDLNHREDRHEIVDAVYRLINNDVNRLELAIHIDHCARGYYDNDRVNELEILALKSMPVEELYGRKTLFHKEQSGDVLVFRNRLFASIDQDDAQSKRIKRITYAYCERVLKNKVFLINEKMERQLVFNLENEEIDILSEREVTLSERDKIYRRVYMNCIKCMQRIAKEAYWYGLNDRVIGRYT